jgi:UDP-glucose 4-epimerase
MHRGETPLVFGDGEQTRDLIFVDDVVRAFIAGGDSDAGGRYNIATEVETSVLQLGEMLAPMCGTTFEPKMEPPRPGEIQRIVTSYARARETLGWEPQVSLEEGLKRTADSFASESSG